MPVGGLLSLQLCLKAHNSCNRIFVCWGGGGFRGGGGDVTYSIPPTLSFVFWGLISLDKISILLFYLPLECNFACILCTLTALIFPNMYHVHVCYLSLINIDSYYETLSSVTLRVNDNLSAYRNDKQCLCNEYDNLYDCLMTRSPQTSGQWD